LVGGESGNKGKKWTVRWEREDQGCSRDNGDLLINDTKVRLAPRGKWQEKKGGALSTKGKSKGEGLGDG